MSRHAIEGVKPAPSVFVDAAEAASRDPSDRIVEVVRGRGRRYSVPALAGALSQRTLPARLDERRGGGGFAAAVATPSLGAVSAAFARMRTDVGEALAGIARDGRWVHVFGDYDVDGVASCTAMSMMLADLRGAPVLDSAIGIYGACISASVVPVVPDREHGYGLSPDWIAKLVADGADRVVCVDNGTNALPALRAAAAAGVAVVVVDHHPPSDEAAAFWARPPAGIIACNPFLPGPLADLLSDAGWGREMCAAVVVEALACEVSARLGRSRSSDWGAVLAGLATVTDVMPLVGPNRRYTTHALLACDGGPAAVPAPLAALVRANLGDRVRGTREDDGDTLLGCALDASFFGFFAGPRLNACGRVDSAERALDFLMAPADAVEAGVAALDGFNDRRRKAEAEAWETTAALFATLLSETPAGPGLEELVAARRSGRRIDALSLASCVQGEDGADGIAVVVPGVVAVVALEGCHPGVAGLLAGSLAGALGIPALALAKPSAPGVGKAPGSGRVPEGSPFRSLHGEGSLGHAVGLAAQEFGGGGGGHASAFGVHLPLPADRTVAAGVVRRFAARLAGLAIDALARAVESGAMVPTDPRHDGAERCDLSIAGSRLGATLAQTISTLGPFGAGHREPLIHVELPPSGVRPLSARSTAGHFLVVPADGSEPPCKMIGFANGFGGGLEDDGFRDFASGLRQGGQAVGRIQQSFFGRGGSRWTGPSAEFVLEAFVGADHG